MNLRRLPADFGGQFLRPLVFVMVHDDFDVEVRARHIRNDTMGLRLVPPECSQLYAKSATPVNRGGTARAFMAIFVRSVAARSVR